MPHRIAISVINDLATDQRVQKVSTTLYTAGYDITLIGRELPHSLPVDQLPYSIRRFKLWWKKGMLFYLNYNLKLLVYLLSKPFDLLLANDLDTLLANYLASKIKGIPLIYDSHELFTEVPELNGRPIKKKLWLKLERWILPKIKFAYTVSEAIASTYQIRYGLPVQVIYNFPFKRKSEPIRKENLILYQGALNKDRGLEELIRAMELINNALLMIIGSGDVKEELKRLVEEMGLQHRVKFKGRMKPEEIIPYTEKAKVGVSLEKESCQSYSYAVPNKIFDYLQAGTPVLHSGLVEVKKLLSDYPVGLTIENHTPQHIAACLFEMMNSSAYDKWVANCKKLAAVYNWESQENKLITLVNEAAGK
jgi:glycosyltransferase involved in cell wall biosynthesis